MKIVVGKCVSFFLMACVVALFAFILPVCAASPGEEAAQVLEQRARAIEKNLRCVVCQGQSIADSNAELARDLRQVVRARLAAGDSDDAVLRYVADRYGDFVLMRPPMTMATALLWFSPWIVLLAAFWFLRRKVFTKGDSVP